MVPVGNAYNIDWVFSNNSDVHVAKHLDWFTSYTPFTTNVSTGLHETTGESALMNILGVGDVSLPVKIDCRKKGRDSHGVLQLRDVLYAPGAPCNILGMPSDVHFRWTSIGQNPSRLTLPGTGACVGLLDLVGVNRLRLSGHSPKQTSLDVDRAYFIGATWPHSERQRWEAVKHKNPDSEDDHPASVLEQSADVPYSVDEDSWLKDHYGDESCFLQAHGYAIHDDQGRTDSRKILRAIIEDDKKGWAELGLRLGHRGLDEDSTEANDDEDDDDDDTSSFVRELEDHPESHFADYHFSNAQLDWIKNNYGCSSNFLLSYGLKFYDDDDCNMGVRLASQLMEDDDLSNAEDDTGKTSTSFSNGLPQLERVGKAGNNHDLSEASIPTVYDETHRGIWHLEPHIASMGHRVCLIAHLEQHKQTTDGSFGVCIAGGSGNFISQELFESIPPKRRPELRKETCSIGMMMGPGQDAVGETFVPIILTDSDDGKRYRVVLHAYVLPKMLMGMFLSNPRWIITQSFGKDAKYECEFGDGKIITLKGPR